MKFRAFRSAFVLSRQLGHTWAGTAEARSLKGPKKHISMSILWGYPYLIGLHYKGFIGDIPILIFSYVLFWGALVLLTN